jgi:hypothetical protein
MNQIDSKYAVKNDQLVIGETVITFDFPIAKIIEMEGMLIVRLDKPINVVYNENVFGVSIAEKKIEWQIEKRSYDPHMKSCPFVDMRIFENRLVLYNWCDTYFVVEPQTGRILEEGYSK